MSLRETITSFFGRRADERPASPDAGLIPAYEETPMGLQNIVDAVKERRAPPPVKANGKDHHAEPAAPLFSAVNPNETRRATAWLEERIRLGARTGWMGQVVKITPVLAEIMLKRNVKNRALKKRAIARYKRAMKDGRWLVTHEGIAFSADGFLIDGQNRLTAIIESGKTVEMPVFFGIASVAFAVIDTGKARTGADTLGIAGHQYSALMAATARMLKSIETKTPFAESVVDNDEIEPFIMAHPGMEEAARITSNVMNQLKSVPSAIATAAYLIGRKHPAEVYTPFFEQLKTGLGFKSNREPIYILRRHITEGRDRMSVAVNDRRLALCGSIIKTWNAYHTGKGARDVLWTGGVTTFPEVE